MIYLAIMVIIVFISMFFNGIQMFRNGKLERKLDQLKEEKIKREKEPKKEVY